MTCLVKFHLSVCCQGDKSQVSTFYSLSFPPYSRKVGQILYGSRDPKASFVLVAYFLTVLLIDPPVPHNCLFIC